MGKDTLTLTDNRTGKSYEIPIENDTIRATDLRQIKINPDDFGIISYDPAYMNTAACASRITYIDGDKGILEYRGYPIEQLAEHSTYLEVAYLLLYGELPTKERLEWWEHRIRRHTFLHQSLIDLIQAFRYDAPPMGILISSVAAMSTLYPEAKEVDDPEVREKQIWRILGMVPTVAAFAYRHRIGRPRRPGAGIADPGGQWRAGGSSCRTSGPTTCCGSARSSCAPSPGRVIRPNPRCMTTR